MVVRKNLNKYEIKSVIGKGAMGVVYKAYDPHMDRFVAIKTLRTDQLDDEEKTNLLTRFRGEARAYGRLLHPNIVTCYSCDEDDGTPFIVMEYVDGETLKQKFDRKETFGVDVAALIIDQLLAALSYSHEHGVIHRDIKPANIMIVEDNRVKVTDFGVARIDSTTLTQTGFVVGSPSYMSPEQFSGNKVDHRTDLFSAGVVFYELITGEKPFSGSDIGAALHNILYSSPPPPSSHNPNAPIALDHVVMKALNKDPSERFGTALEFGKSLHLALGQSDHANGARQTGIDLDETVLSTPSEHMESTTTQVPSSLASATRSSDAEEGSPQFVRGGRSLKTSWIAAAVLSIGGVGFIGLSMLDNERPQTSLSTPAVLGLEGGSAEANLSGRRVSTRDESVAVLPDEEELRRLVSGYHCASVDARVDGQSVELYGYVGSEGDAAAIREAVEALPAVQDVKANVEVHAWPYCELITTLRPFTENAMSDGSGEADPLLPGEENYVRYKEGDNLQLDLIAPRYNAHMYVDYFLLDGSVVHMMPNPLQQDNKMAAGEFLRIGEPTPGKRLWKVEPPFGREMITIIGANEPLFDEHRPEVEEAKDYLAALKQRIDGRGKGGLTASYTYILTEADTP